MARPAGLKDHDDAAFLCGRIPRGRFEPQKIGKNRSAEVESAGAKKVTARCRHFHFSKSCLSLRSLRLCVRFNNLAQRRKDRKGQNGFSVTTNIVRRRTQSTEG